MEPNPLTRPRAETDGGRLMDRPHPAATVEMLKQWRIISRHWMLILLTAFVVSSSIVVYDHYFATWTYQATSIIMPMTPDQADAQTSGDSGGLLGGASGGLATMLLGQGDNEMVAENYMAIMNSFDFTMNLVKRFHLATRLIAKEGDDPATMQPYDIYQWINGNFDAEYDYKSGNLALTYIDRDPAMAREVLGYYLQSLQDKLRAEEINSATVAAKSLEDEVAHTSDTLLQQQLYELLAHQIQRQKLAQMQADFAFKMIEPPMVPDFKYAPHGGKSGVLAGFLVIFAMSTYILVRAWLKQASAHLRASDSNVIPLTDPSPRDERAPRETPPAIAEKLRLPF